MKNKLKLTIPCDKQYLSPVLDFNESICRGLSMDTREVLKTRLALEEAIMNVIIHGLREDSGETITFEFIISDACLVISIKEKGIPFDVNVMQRDMDTRPDMDTQKGIGSSLIGYAVDKVEYLYNGREGKETKLIKYLTSDDDNRSREIPPLVPLAKTVDRSFRIIPFEPADALDISRLVWNAYGYTYSHGDYIYYPDRLTEHNCDKSLVSMVAKSSDGQVIGHAGLHYNGPYDPVPEIGMAFVDPRYRRLNVFHQLNQALIEHARRNNAKGFFVEAVCSHIGSQSAADHYDLFPVGLMPCLFPAKTKYKGISDAITNRESALSFIHLFDNSDRTIYPPSRHGKMIESLYQTAGINYTIGNADKYIIEETPGTLIVSSLPPDYGGTIFEIHRYGKDTVKEIRRIASDLVGEGIQVMLLQLPLEDPWTPEKTVEFEAMGFFFSGIRPFGLKGRDMLTLEFLNKIEIDTKVIQLAHASSRHLLEYITRNLPDNKDRNRLNRTQIQK